MSFQSGMAALNLEMTNHVPRTEYSADGHWKLIQKVTGIAVDENSPAEERSAASRAFIKAWDYAFLWSVLIHAEVFGDVRTKMGHANYAAGNVDFIDDRGSWFKDEEDVLGFDALEVFGEVDRRLWKAKFEKHYRDNRAYFPDAVSTTGTYVTCVSGMIDLFGWDLLLAAAGEDPDRFGKVVTRYGDWMMGHFEALAESDVPVVMVHDDLVWTSGPFIRPEWYRRYVFPQIKRYLAPLREAGKKIMFTSDGDYTAFIDDVAACGIDCFVMEPMTDMAYIAERYGKTHSFVGNADTRVLLMGSKEDIYAEVKRCMDIGKNCPGFMMAVGNHIPANTPVDACLYYQEAYEKLGRR
ncbi:MAG: hypothetical protein IJC25_02470 [Clostridia bacterium]|nr:hypothetical protein [Clostridia bacterium]